MRGGVLAVAIASSSLACTGGGDARGPSSDSLGDDGGTADDGSGDDGSGDDDSGDADDDGDGASSGDSTGGDDGDDAASSGDTGCEQDYYLDADGDGHGDPLAQITTCTPPDDHVPNGDDCDDTNPMAAPMLPEACDGQDNDCDRMVDEDNGGVPCHSCTIEKNGASMYLYCPDPDTFDGSRTFCMGYGGDLLEIDDEAEYAFISAAALPATADGLGYRHGLNDIAVEGTFVWTDGSVPASIPWAVGEPNDAGGNEDCVEFAPGGGLWNDMVCTEPRAFICETM